MKPTCLHPWCFKEHILSFGQVTYNFALEIISYDYLIKLPRGGVLCSGLVTTTLPYTTLHYLYYTTLHFTTVHYTTL